MLGDGRFRPKATRMIGSGAVTVSAPPVDLKSLMAPVGRALGPLDEGDGVAPPHAAVVLACRAGHARVRPDRVGRAVVRRRAGAAEIGTAIGNHSFRATGITTYLKNGGTLETAATMANHSSTRTTQLYDRRPDDVTLDEVERVLI